MIVEWIIVVWLALAVLDAGRGAAAAFDSPLVVEHDETAPDPTAPGGTS